MRSVKIILDELGSSFGSIDVDTAYWIADFASNGRHVEMARERTTAKQGQFTLFQLNKSLDLENLLDIVKSAMLHNHDWEDLDVTGLPSDLALLASKLEVDNASLTESMDGTLRFCRKSTPAT